MLIQQLYITAKLKTLHLKRLRKKFVNKFEQTHICMTFVCKNISKEYGLSKLAWLSNSYFLLLTIIKLCH